MVSGVALQQAPLINAEDFKTKYSDLDFSLP
uniref:Uncharacterized protein n=1 Tax=Rhizophora mucronata TaxID=61149 RepID=A0A2P2R1X9_RHIMU